MDPSGGVSVWRLLRVATANVAVLPKTVAPAITPTGVLRGFEALKHQMLTQGHQISMSAPRIRVLHQDWAQVQVGVKLEVRDVLKGITLAPAEQKQLQWFVRGHMAFLLEVDTATGPYACFLQSFNLYRVTGQGVGLKRTPLSTDVVVEMPLKDAADIRQVEARFVEGESSHDGRHAKLRYGLRTAPLCR